MRQVSKNYFFGLAVLGLSALPGWAQGTIRSGEHGEFTRLVLPVPDIESWTIIEETDKPRLIFEPEVEFSVAQIFERIDQSRLREIDTSPGQVELGLACDCIVEAYIFQDIYLVIDISERPGLSLGEIGRDETPDTPTQGNSGLLEEQMTSSTPTENFIRQNVELELDPPEQLRETFQPQTPLRPSDNVSASTATALLLAGLDDLLAAGRAAASETDPPAEATPVSPAMPVDIEAAARSLSEQVARAAAAGLLQAAPLEPFAAGDEPLDTPSLAQETSGAAPIRAANAFDIVLDRDSGLDAAARALTCTERVEDVSSWSNDLGFDQELGRLRQSVTNERGGVVDSDALALARYYIFYGFGAEAEFWLLQMQDPPIVELAIARYLNGSPGPNFPPVDSLAFCTPEDLLWRYIDNPDMPQLATRQIDEMQLAFLRLPQTLRSFIGPEYVLRLSQDGHHAAAEDIREALSSGTVLSQDEELLLALQTGALPVASADLDQLSATLQNGDNDRLETMTQYLSVARQQGVLAGNTEVIAAEALLRETQMPPDIGGLWHEVALSHAISGRNERLFEMLDTVNLSMLPNGPDILTTIFEELLQNENGAATVILATRTITQPGVDALTNDIRQDIFDFLDRSGLNDLSAPYALAPMSMTRSEPEQVTSDARALPRASADRMLSNLASSTPSNTLDPTILRQRLDDSAALRGAINELLLLDNN